MNNFNIQNLLTVKSIVTLVLTLLFVYSVITKIVDGESFMSVYLMIIGFYFGTQFEKAQGSDNNGTDKD